MSSYYTPKNVVIGRHWKRPKPRVYECNVRDAERFYQETYKDYLQSKDFAARRASEDRTTRYEDEPASRWTVRRTNSLADSSLDSGARDSLRNGGLSSSYFDSSIGSSRGRGEDSYSTSVRASSVVNQRRESPEGEIATIEQRLSRLRKLREDLGLPSEAGGSISFSPSASAANVDSRDRKTKVLESTTSTYSTARGSSRSRDVDPYADKYSTGTTERTSKYKSKYSNGDDSYNSRSSDKGTTSKYSSKYGSDDEPSVSKYASKYKDDESSYSRMSDIGSRQNGRSVTFNTGVKDDADSYSSYKSSSRSSNRKYDQDGDSSYGVGSSGKSYKTASSESKSYKSAARNMDDDDIGNYDDDELLSSIKKKFPTSDEILQRIKKLDDDL